MTLTPADIGILQAAKDDAINQGYGDDAIVDEVTWAALSGGVTADETAAADIAYAFIHG